ncbi:hypothetical protein B0H11DRAFT_2257914 [Mycena galericulata]|nr:hypothetical protein B0H11DRAFT_2257914 [Mycena galericulata]
MSSNGQYYDPKLSQPAPAYYQGSPNGNQNYPMMSQQGYNSSQPQMHPAPQPQIFVNVTQNQKQKGSSCCCPWWGSPRHNISRCVLIFFF